MTDHEWMRWPREGESMGAYAEYMAGFLQRQGRVVRMTDPASIRGRWTIHVCENHRRVDCVLCGVHDVVEVVPVPDERAIERAIRALEECNWRSGSLTIGTRMLVDAVLAAALDQPER